MLVTKPRILIQSFIDDSLEVGRNVAIHTNERHWGFVKHGVKNRARGISTKRQNAASHLVTNDAERKEVGARVQFPSENLFR